MISIENSPDPSCSSPKQTELIKADETISTNPDIEQEIAHSPTPNFSIRDYVFRSRSKGIGLSWPFHPNLLQLCLKHGVKDLLPPFEPPDLVKNRSVKTNTVKIHQEITEPTRIDLPKPANESKSTVNQVVNSTENTTNSDTDNIPLVVIKDQTKRNKGIIAKEINSNNNSMVLDPMGSKICPVCKVFQSSSNTTLNAHIDQCLSTESGTKRYEAELLRPRIKPRKKKSMMEIYETAMHCTLEDLDRRNGTKWAALEMGLGLARPEQCNPSWPENARPVIPVSPVVVPEVPVVPDLTGEERDSAVYVDSNGIKLRILSKFDDTLIPSAQKEELRSGVEGLFGKKKKKKMMMKKNKKNKKQFGLKFMRKKKLKGRGKGKKFKSFEVSKSPVQLGADDDKTDRTNQDPEPVAGPALLGQWVCSKRSYTPKKLNKKNTCKISENFGPVRNNLCSPSTSQPTGSNSNSNLPVKNLRLRLPRPIKNQIFSPNDKSYEGITEKEVNSDNDKNNNSSNNNNNISNNNNNYSNTFVKCQTNTDSSKFRKHRSVLYTGKKGKMNNPNKRLRTSEQKVVSPEREQRIVVEEEENEKNEHGNNYIAGCESSDREETPMEIETNPSNSKDDQATNQKEQENTIIIAPSLSIGRVHDEPMAQQDDSSITSNREESSSRDEILTNSGEPLESPPSTISNSTMSNPSLNEPKLKEPEPEQIAERPKSVKEITDKPFSCSCRENLSKSSVLPPLFIGPRGSSNSSFSSYQSFRPKSLMVNGNLQSPARSISNAFNATCSSPGSSQIHVPASPSNPILRLMGKNLLVVNQDEIMIQPGTPNSLSPPPPLPPGFLSPPPNPILNQNYAYPNLGFQSMSNQYQVLPLPNVQETPVRHSVPNRRSNAQYVPKEVIIIDDSTPDQTGLAGPTCPAPANFPNLSSILPSRPFPFYPSQNQLLSGDFSGMRNVYPVMYPGNVLEPPMRASPFTFPSPPEPSGTFRRVNHSVHYTHTFR